MIYPEIVCHQDKTLRFICLQLVNWIKIWIYFQLVKSLGIIQSANCHNENSFIRDTLKINIIIKFMFIKDYFKGCKKEFGFSCN